jgi:hypothetical protein
MPCSSWAVASPPASMARTSVPAPVASEETVVQSVVTLPSLGIYE